jgi:hypothetical protein
MDIQRTMKVQDKFFNLPDEAKKYVNDLVNEARQNPKSTVLKNFYDKTIKNGKMDLVLSNIQNPIKKRNWLDQLKFNIATNMFLIVTGISIPKCLRENHDLFMLVVAIASNFLVEGSYYERYNTRTLW